MILTICLFIGILVTLFGWAAAVAMFPTPGRHAGGHR